MQAATGSFTRGDMSSTKQQNAPSLTPELWAKVFAHLEQQADNADIYTGTQNQADVHQLKLVCKQFRGIVESHSELVQRLFLDSYFSFVPRKIPSLLAWLHQNKGSIRVFCSECRSPPVDIVMAGLCSAPNITVVDLSDVNAYTVSIIGTCIGLEQCSLAHMKAEHVGLALLGALPKLRQLMLRQGNYKELHHMTSLTWLECGSSCVLDAQEFPPALQYLAITDSDFVGVHAQTLPACTALAHLELRNASLRGNNAYVYFDRDLSVVPTSIGQLTQLQTLHLSTDGAEGEHAKLQWVSELIFLQALSMHFDDGSADILHCLSALTKLTYLHIEGFDDPGDACPLDLDFEWRKLQALHKLSIKSRRLRLGENMFGLLQLSKLQEVSLAGNVVHSPSDIDWFATLIYKFARLRPEVKACVWQWGLGRLSCMMCSCSEVTCCLHCHALHCSYTVLLDEFVHSQQLLFKMHNVLHIVYELYRECTTCLMKKEKSTPFSDHSRSLQP